VKPFPPPPKLLHVSKEEGQRGPYTAPLVWCGKCGDERFATFEVEGGLVRAVQRLTPDGKLRLKMQCGHWTE